MFDAQGLVPCLLQQVLPLIMNHEEADTILEDPKVQLNNVGFNFCINLLLPNVFVSFHWLLQLTFVNNVALVIRLYQNLIPILFYFQSALYTDCNRHTLLVGFSVFWFLLSPGLGSCSVDGTHGVPRDYSWTNAVKRRFEGWGNWTVRSVNRILDIFRSPWYNRYHKLVDQSAHPGWLAKLKLQLYHAPKRVCELSTSLLGIQQWIIHSRAGELKPHSTVFTNMTLFIKGRIIKQAKWFEHGEI